jgi:hypothetical protein
LVLTKLKKDQSLSYKDISGLQGLVVEDLKDDQSNPSINSQFEFLIYFFILSVKNVKTAFLLKGVKTILFSAKTPADKTAWIQKFNTALSGKA